MIMMNIVITWLALLDWGYPNYSMLLEKKILLQMNCPIQWVYFFRYWFHYALISQVIALEISVIFNYKNCLLYLEQYRKQTLSEITLRISMRYQSHVCSGLVKYGVNTWTNLRWRIISIESMKHFQNFNSHVDRIRILHVD